MEEEDGDIGLLLDWGLQPNLLKPKQPIVVAWQPPPWIKINVDGARKGENRQSGAGFVVRSHDAKLIAVASILAIDNAIN